MKKLILVISVLFATYYATAQNDKKENVEKSFSVDGAVCLTVDDHGIFYYNMGGAQIKFDFDHKFAFSITLLPSIVIEQLKVKNDYGETETKLNTRPTLGIGPQLFYKKFILSFPFYYNNGNKNWYASAGIGYKIQFSKSQK